MKDLDALLEHCRDRQAFYERQGQACERGAAQAKTDECLQKREAWARKKFAIAAQWECWANQLAEVIELDSIRRSAWTI